MQAGVSSRKRSHRKHPGPLTLGGLAFSLGTAATLPSRAATSCDLEVTGPDTPAWREAVGSLDLRASDDSDCGTIRLTLGAEASRLTFVTKDGRIAERELREPSELAPTLEALLVTGEAARPEPAPEPEPDRPRPARRESLAPQRPVEVDALNRPVPTAPTLDTLTAAFTVALGVRGGAGGLVSPVVYGAVTMDRNRWEIGVWGALEPHYAGVGGDATAPVELTAPEPQTTVRPQRVGPPEPGSAAAVGVMCGRRFPFTHLDLVLGARLGVAAVRRFDGWNDGTEVRVGTGADLVFPRASTVRFRTGFGAEVVPNELGRSGTATVPSWALVARVGVEVGGS
jgi:hypothetical protein